MFLANLPKVAPSRSVAGRIVKAKQMSENTRPMKDFDPRKSGQEVYDELNDLWFEWNPEWANISRESATPNEPDGSTMLFDGYIIAGWRPLRPSGKTVA